MGTPSVGHRRHVRSRPAICRRIVRLAGGLLTLRMLIRMRWHRRRWSNGPRNEIEDGARRKAGKQEKEWRSSTDGLHGSACLSLPSSSSGRSSTAELEALEAECRDIEMCGPPPPLGRDKILVLNRTGSKAAPRVHAVASDLYPSVDLRSEAVAKEEAKWMSTDWTIEPHDDVLFPLTVRNDPESTLVLSPD